MQPVDKQNRRINIACVRCRRRHIKCPGGEPCLKCQQSNAACEYIEADKKVIVSMKYLQKLHDEIANLKKENNNLRVVSKEIDKLQHTSVPSNGGASGVATSSVSRLSKELMIEDNLDSILNVTFQDNTKSNEINQAAGEINDEVIAPFIDNQHKLVYSKTGEKFYVGSSSMTLFGMQVQNMLLNNENVINNNDLNNNNLTTTETVLQNEGNAYTIMLGKSKNNPGISVNFTLPSYSYSMLLIDTFITYNDGCFYFFNEGLIKENLKRIYKGLGTDSSDSIIETIWFCKVLLIFAVGEMYLGTSNNINGTKTDSNAKLPGSGFFHQASELFTGLFSSGAIDNCAREGGIEVLLLYAFYLQVADCTVASYFYFGLALRASLILGMHVDADKDSLSRFELEHRRRLWWTVYMFERMLSSKAGLPLSLNDNSIATELPDDFDMMHPPPGYEHYIFPEAEYITNCIKITQINAKILSCLYQKQPTSNILPILIELVSQLIDWKQNLPYFLRPDFSQIDDQKDFKISRLVTNIMTEYFQGINLAVRPLLFHFVNKQLKENSKQNKYIDLNNYSNSIITLFNSSFQASINTIRSLWYLMSENMVALFGYMDREYLFTSAATLILFNATFGVHKETYAHLNHALKIFTKMRNLGNHPADLRRSQLLKLMSSLDFNNLMNDLLMEYQDKNVKPVSNIDNPAEQPPAKKQKQNPGQGQVQNTSQNQKQQPSKGPAQAIYDQPLNTEFNLNSIDALNFDESELWNEISNEAVWLSKFNDITEEVQSMMNADV